MPALEIKILGPGCRNCLNLDKATRTAVAEMEITATIEKIEDYSEIASYNIMQTPGLVVDGTVVVSGRVPSTKEIKELIAAARG